MRRLALLAGFALLLASGGAHAQVDSREGIALQNQILQLRQELEVLRRGGVAAPAPSRPAAGGAPASELVQGLLDRVQRLEEEVRSVRGRAEQAEFRERQLRERVEKLEGDIDFRLQQIEGQRSGAATPRPAQPAPATPAAGQGAANAPRTPQRAIAEGQAALARRDFPAAEAAAREVIASRDAAQQVNAQILLGDALLGRGNAQAAAIAFDDARRRSPQGARAAEANVGLANAFIALNINRDACTVLNELRSQNPNLAGPVAERAADARRRAGCR